MENAEVLEMTVKRVESILQNRAQGKHYTFKFINQQAVKYFTFHNQNKISSLNLPMT